VGHEAQFAPPRLIGGSAFSEETFAGRCGNEKDADSGHSYDGSRTTHFDPKAAGRFHR